MLVRCLSSYRTCVNLALSLLKRLTILAKIESFQFKMLLTYLYLNKTLESLLKVFKQILLPPYQLVLIRLD